MTSLTQAAKAAATGETVSVPWGHETYHWRAVVRPSGHAEGRYHWLVRAGVPRGEHALAELVQTTVFASGSKPVERVFTTGYKPFKLIFDKILERCYIPI